MKKFLLILPAILLIGAGCASTPAPTAPPVPQTPPPVSANPTPTPASNKFADQPYYKNSYLISTDSLSVDAQAALSGFSMSKKNLPDGTVEYDLKATKAGYNDQSYVLKAGEQLYFIDNYAADDDMIGGTDKNTGDDMGVVVDASGNIVSGPTNWTTSGTTPPAVVPPPSPGRPTSIPPVPGARPQ